MRSVYILILFLISSICSAQIKKKKVLFIGNSYTYVNNLPQLIKDIALSKSDTLIFDQSLLGGATFNTHYNNAQTYSLIKSQSWDVVVIQGQSQEPSLSQALVMNNSYPYLKRLSDSVRKYVPCAELMYFMTWGRKNGDPDNCPTYTPSCSYAGMQARLRESYLMFADSFNAACAPVGVAWKTFRNTFPQIDLYDLDESHPSINGSYLAACVFYSSVFQKAASGATFYATLSPSVAQSMQTIGGNTVLDSVNVWNLNSNIPTPNFTYSFVNGNTVQFTNVSLNSNTQNWSFGSTLHSPVYSFTAAPPYVVTLTVSNSCTSAVITKTLGLTSQTEALMCMPVLNYFQESSSFSLEFCQERVNGTLFVSDMMGRVLLKKEVNETQVKLDLNFLPEGIYLCVLETPEGQYISKKILK